MGQDTAIEWADHTFNPWVGCTKVSPGCDHCYAESWAKRAGKAAGVEWGGDRRRTTEANWRRVRQWNEQSRMRAAQGGRRLRVFCASLADVFDNQVPVEWREDLFILIEGTPHLDWLLLTKRIGNAAELMFRARGGHLPVLPNVWVGATVTSQAEADRDIPKLLATPARVRFLSIEPMLGPVNLQRLRTPECVTNWPAGWHFDALTGRYFCGREEDPEEVGLSHKLSWVICGGESGPGARPMHPDWARSLRDQCAAAGVPFLFKQWGEWVSVSEVAGDGPHFTFPDGATVRRVGKKTAGRQLDGHTRDEFPKG